MRAAILIIGGLIGSGFVLLGVLILIIGKAKVPTHGADYSAVGITAYAMGVAWLGLGAANLSVSLLRAELGSRHHVLLIRDASFLIFGFGFVTALILAILKVFANVAT